MGCIMAQRYARLDDRLTDFIKRQRLFFVGTAAAEGRVNISPKGMDTLRVLDPERVLWLNLTGSGNETSAHVQQNPRMTLLFAAFEGAPLILRLYGSARVIHRNDPDWDGLYRLFEPRPGARQLFDMRIELVQTSCGMAVPLFDFVADRTQLSDWAEKKGEQGIRAYWAQNNTESLDGVPTRILELNTRGDEEI